MINLVATLETSVRKVTVSEVFSPPRVVQMAKSMNVDGPGLSFDIAPPDPTSGRSYELKTAGDTNAVVRHVHFDRPMYLIMSPPCRMCSNLQRAPPPGGEQVNGWLNIARPWGMLSFAVHWRRCSTARVVISSSSIPFQH